jgi:imidazolonepropionase
MTPDRQNGNILVENAAQVAMCSGVEARVGAAMSVCQEITEAGVLSHQGRIAAVGSAGHIAAVMTANGWKREDFTVIDAAGKAVVPGLIDGHTHLVFAGHRTDEFFWRLRGDSYLDILGRGGGILSTVAATRQASVEALTEAGLQHLDTMLGFGVTTVEAKSGYGLDLATEIKQLEVAGRLNRRHCIDVVPTFLGAHAVAPEFKGRPEAYVDWMIAEALPEVARRGLAEFCDVFCETGVFSVAQSRRLLAAARDLGFKLKIHADEMTPLGGAELAAELEAVSADHLLHASPGGLRAMAQAGVVAVLLPTTAFGLRQPYADAGAMLAAGCAVALATDFNPGTCFSESIPLVAALAAVHLNLGPAQILNALTINAAASLGRAGTLGSLDVGKAADLVILAHPSHAFLAYRLGVSTVEKVVKAGCLVFDRNQGGLMPCSRN